jgi:transcriptional regulator
VYVPDVFARRDSDALAAHVRAHPLALLVCGGDEEPLVAHVPLVLAEGGPHGTLLGHVARASPLADRLARGAPAAAVFTGPHAYVSPTMYATAGQVPTWNYVAVHASGTPRVLDDPGARDVLERMVACFETDRPAPWRIADLPAAKAAALVREITAFELPIARLTGKWKVGQNRKAVDRLAAADALAASGDPDARAIAAWMRAVADDRG